jgi:hypothetical protein
MADLIIPYEQKYDAVQHMTDNTHEPRNNISVEQNWSLSSNMHEETQPSIPPPPSPPSPSPRRLINLNTDNDFGTSWDPGNITTLHIWINDCNKRQFIYDNALEKVAKKSKKINITILIFGGIMSLITGINLGITDQSNSSLSWGIKIATFVISAIIYTLSQYSGLCKFDDTIKAYTMYTNCISNFLSIIVSTVDMKVQFRPDGDKFIMDNNTIYTKLRRDAPYIDQTYWTSGALEYNKYIKDADIEDGGSLNYLQGKMSIAVENINGKYKSLKN